MQHDNESAAETQASTTMISTKGHKDQKDDEDFTPAVVDLSDNNENEVLDDEDAAQRLDSFDKLGRNFVRALSLTVEDVGANDNYRQKLLDVAADCFTNIIRLSNTLTGC